MEDLSQAPQKETLTKLITAFTEIPFNRMLGLQLERVDAKAVSMNFDMKDELIGNFFHGILHGGVISSVLDMAGGMVVMAAALYKYSHKSPQELVSLISKTSTVDLQISYLRPGKGQKFTAHAQLIKSGNTVSFARMELFNQEKQLIATGQGTYLLR